MQQENIPNDWLPFFTWPLFFYDKQVDFVHLPKWQAWFIGGNGTGKTTILKWSNVAFMLGAHPIQMSDPPIKIKSLVPSFDHVEDVALEKLLEPQRIIFPIPLNEKQHNWIEFLKEKSSNDKGELTGKGPLLDYKIPDTGEGQILVGPMLPKSMLIPKKGFSKEHKGIELKNGSSIWFATSEQGWQAQRGGEQDVLDLDEEPEERVYDECLRGLRNAKGGGRVIAGLTPPYQPGQGPTWTKEKIVENSLKDPDIGVINSCMKDNPAITKEFIRRFSIGKSQRQIDVQVFGKYPTWGDLVYEDYQDREWDEEICQGHLLPRSTPMPDYYEVKRWVMAFDWHPSKPTAAIWGYVDAHDNIVFFDELDRNWAEGKKVSELADAFFQIEGRRKFQRWQDPSAKVTYKAIKRDWNAWEEFRKYGIFTFAGKNFDQEVGINIVGEYLRGDTKDHPRVFFYENMKWTRQYMSNHYWRRSDMKVKGEPDPKYSDYPVCVRYVLQDLGARKHHTMRKQWPKYTFQPVKDERKIIDISSIL